ncbi:hypothetical protein PVW53_16480, partial [Seohaeicola sp. SP36]|nr:hypothetical protein [Seohaeicola sp. SP36]
MTVTTRTGPLNLITDVVGLRVGNATDLTVKSGTTWCDCGGRSPVANEVRYVGLMYIRREENDLWNIMLVWMC